VAVLIKRAFEPAAQKLKIVGLLMKYHKDDMRINPFYSQVILGAERECQNRRLSLM